MERRQTGFARSRRWVEGEKRRRTRVKTARGIGRVARGKTGRAARTRTSARLRDRSPRRLFMAALRNYVVGVPARVSGHRGSANGGMPFTKAARGSNLTRGDDPELQRLGFANSILLAKRNREAFGPLSAPTPRVEARMRTFETDRDGMEADGAAGVDLSREPRRFSTVTGRRNGPTDELRPAVVLARRLGRGRGCGFRASEYSVPAKRRRRDTQAACAATTTTKANERKERRSLQPIAALLADMKARGC